MMICFAFLDLKIGLYLLGFEDCYCLMKKEKLFVVGLDWIGCWLLLEPGLYNCFDVSENKENLCHYQMFRISCQPIF